MIHLLDICLLLTIQAFHHLLHFGMIKRRILATGFTSNFNQLISFQHRVKCRTLQLLRCFDATKDTLLLNLFLGQLAIR